MASFSSVRCRVADGPIIVGAGPSGLAVAACLRQKGVPFTILERGDCIASLWHKRTYDHLKLHLPKKSCQLPGMPFPDHFPEYPTRKQYVHYLRNYAAHFDIHPKFIHDVQWARYDETSGMWRVSASTADGEVQYNAPWLVVATGPCAYHVVPDIPGLSGFGGEVTHAGEYKSGDAYSGKRVLVVGSGSFGWEVSLDLCDHGARPAMVVCDAVRIMRWMPVWLVNKILVLLTWLFPNNLASLGFGRPAAGLLEVKETNGQNLVLDVGALAKIRSGDIALVPGVTGFSNGKAEFANGRSLEIDAIVVATRYRSNYSPQWLQMSLTN